ncbi:restriction endonuclease [Blastococcus sp. KM273129]|uniref:restriction endonuclease n=1 Tax=Blastococcus sp. KM273129 TaxID=2570315 RepID=UPI001F1F8949|nr:restriction endonuclease [Blastococcus sp. KM273129]MCF6735228.1 restriction endonuclease [Blastococcus sp. KM273129]
MHRAAGVDPAPNAVIKTWQDAERLAASHMRRLGFEDARVTATGADGGIDVWATGAVAQVKFQWSKTGRPAVQALHRVATAHQAEALFYAIDYTQQALTYANNTGIALFLFDSTGDVAPITKAGHALAARSASSTPKIGFLARGRADRYRYEAEALRKKLGSLTARMQKQTQARAPKKRAAAGQAAAALLNAGQLLDKMEVLPPQDRRREDYLNVARGALAMAKKWL